MRCLLFAALAAIFAAAPGCSTGPAISEVEGVVSYDGKPLPEITITFFPDSLKANKGFRSSATTDAQGRFILQYESTPPRPGATVGWHKVVIEDTRSENTRPSPPPRTLAEYQSSTTTPLTAKVEPGTKQTIDFDLKVKKTAP